jgi:peptidoglycan/LPS O-acetylase OafA/YrhL
MGLLRFMLALAVASGHAGGFFAADIYPQVAGNIAVQIFYMISGFLIALILSGKYADTPQGNWIFYSNRAVKIYVPYLAILAVTVVVSLMSYAAGRSPLALAAFFSEGAQMSFGTWLFAIVTNLFLIGMEWSSLLIDRGGQLFFSLTAIEQPPSAIQFNIIVPAWTLSLELMFYLIAPFILRRHFLLIAALALASYLFRFEAYAQGYRSLATEYRFFPFELSLFLYGALNYRVYRFLKERELMFPAFSLAFTAICVVGAISLPQFIGQHPHQLYAVIGLALPSLFDFSTRHRWDRWLGDLSYPLYLVHWPVCVFALAIASEPAKGPLYAYLVVIASIGLSIAINHFLVYPVDQWRQNRARRAAEIGLDAPRRQDASVVA